jgi:hypothetical protein
MNYIQQLEQDKLVLTAATQAALIGLAEMMAYLHEDKFQINTTVEVRDIINRIHEIRKAMYDAGAAT